MLLSSWGDKKLKRLGTSWRLFSVLLVILNEICTKFTEFILEILLAWSYIHKNQGIIVFSIQ